MGSVFDRFRLAAALRTFTQEDMARSLQELGLSPSAVLLVLPFVSFSLKIFIIIHPLVKRSVLCYWCLFFLSGCAEILFVHVLDLTNPNHAK